MYASSTCAAPAGPMCDIVRAARSTLLLPRRRAFGRPNIEENLQGAYNQFVAWCQEHGRRLRIAGLFVATLQRI